LQVIDTAEGESWKCAKKKLCRFEV
jgi:hypothetical protein